MLAGLALLTGAVCLLACSGFWGLSRYRRLADSVSSAAREIDAANELHREAVTLMASYQWFANFDRPMRLLGGSDLSDTGLFESNKRQRAMDTFEMTLSILGNALANYQDELRLAPASDSFLPDLRKRQQSLDDVATSFDLVQRLNLQPRDPNIDHELSDAVAQLADSAKRHVDEIQQSMAAFSEDIKVEYGAAITFASGCLIVALGMVGFLLWRFWALIIQPFRTLLEGSRMVANQAAFGHRITLGTGDELDELAEAMNAMSSKFLMVYNHSENLRQNLEQEVRDRTREVIRNEQLASVGFLAAGVAHEINNPLTTIAWGAESLESEWEETDEAGQVVINGDSVKLIQTTLKQIQSEAFRCKGITDRLLDFSRMSEVRRESTDLAALVDDVVELVSKVGEYRCKTIRTHHTDRVIAEVNSHQIRQVVLNLITNALESVDSNGAVEVSVFQENRNAKIVVEDNGCGMTEEVMTHLFEPFFTRRRNGQGTGLGLSITCRIVSQHGGSLTPFSEGEGKGSKLEVTLPLHAEKEDSDPETNPSLTALIAA